MARREVVLVRVKAADVIFCDRAGGKRDDLYAVATTEQIVVNYNNIFTIGGPYKRWVVGIWVNFIRIEWNITRADHPYVLNM